MIHRSIFFPPRSRAPESRAGNKNNEEPPAKKQRKGSPTKLNLGKPPSPFDGTTHSSAASTTPPTETSSPLTPSTFSTEEIANTSSPMHVDIIEKDKESGAKNITPERQIALDTSFASPPSAIKQTTAAISETIPVIFTIKDGAPIINISTTRTDTIAGKSQGDHVTAFRTFIELIFNAVADQDLGEAAQTLKNITGALFKRQQGENSFSKTCEDFLKNHESDNASRDLRKTLTAHLRSLQELHSAFQVMQKNSVNTILSKRQSDAIKLLETSHKTLCIESNIEKIKHSLKSGSDALLGQLIAEIASQIIKQLNQDKDMVCFKGDDEKEEEEEEEIASAASAPEPQAVPSGHGNEVKQALHTLRLINNLLKINKIQNPEERQAAKTLLLEKINEPNSLLKQGLRNIALHCNPQIPKLSKKRSSFHDLTLKALMESLLENNTIFELSAQPNYFSEIVGKKIGKLFDYPCKQGRQLDDLCKLITRHIAIIANAFSELQPILKEQNTLPHLINQEIIGAQGWGQNKDQKGKDVIFSEILGKIKKLVDSENFILDNEYAIEYKANPDFAKTTAKSSNSLLSVTGSRKQ